MNGSVHLIGMSGSLRKDSFNTRLLFAAQELLPENVTMGIVSIADQPLYNADLDIPTAKQRPEVVQQFRDVLATADGFVFVSREYNYSIPGGLKNAIDWASRGEDSPLMNKPGCSDGCHSRKVGNCENANGISPRVYILKYETCSQT